MSDITLSPQYTAGLFDADGTLSIIRTRRGGTTRHQLSVAVTNCCAPVIAAIRIAHGGAFIRKTLPSTAANGQRDTYEWHAACRVAASFLTHLLPHLIIKRAEAEVALAFQRRITVTRGVRLSDAEMEAREALAVECSRLKRVRYDENSLPVAPSTCIVGPAPKRWNKTGQH